MKALIGLAALPLAPLAKLAPKFHTGGIVHKGAYVVGSSNSCFMRYNYGPVSWLHSHSIIYPNGQRKIVEITG